MGVRPGVVLVDTNVLLRSAEGHAAAVAFVRFARQPAYARSFVHIASVAHEFRQEAARDFAIPFPLARLAAPAAALQAVRARHAVALEDERADVEQVALLAQPGVLGLVTMDGALATVARLEGGQATSPEDLAGIRRWLDDGVGTARRNDTHVVRPDGSESVRRGLALAAEWAWVCKDEDGAVMHRSTRHFPDADAAWQAARNHRKGCKDHSQETVRVQ